MNYRKYDDLTYAEQKALDFIRDYRNKNQISPSIREIGAALGVDSTSQIEFYVNNLVKAGRIKRTKRVARSVVVIT
jgi:SOS-response transcriptional repressor LexA